MCGAVLAWELPLIRRSGQEIMVKISRESKTAREITESLKEQKILKHPRLFRFFIKLLGWDKKIRVGTYLFRENEAWPMLLRKLINGESFTVKVTFPEGWRIEQMAERLESSMITSAADFTAGAKAGKMEGFLFPSTYFFEPDTPAPKVIEVMNEQFEKMWKERFEYLKPPKKFGKKEVVTLASIIERETTVLKEKPLIAGVFLNRLRLGWRLEADPTVQYALAKWKERLTYKDTKIKSPYNTYQNAGLPPGPIANPGADSIAAVFYPTKTELMYFVARGDGSHEFFKTLAEHNRYRALQKKNRKAKIKK